jgi:ammonium transporter, Amt family
MSYVIVGALGALLIRLGYAVHAAGMARSKNSAGAVMRQLCDLCVALLSFWAVGYSIVSVGNGVFGFAWRELLGPSNPADPDVNFAPLALAMLIGVGIVPGVLAERARFWPSLAISALSGALIFPLAMLWTGTGWLHKMWMVDSRGALSLHLPGAACAAVGAVFVGARTGKFNRDGSSTAIPGHSVPLAGVGAFILLVGFVMFVGQSPAALTNVLMAGAAGGLAAVILGQFRYYKPDIHLTYAGVVGALVAISAGGGAIPSPAAVVIGAVAGVIVPLAILSLDVYARIDDPSGNVAVHGVGAIWGLIAAPLMARNLSIGERFKGLGVNLLAIVVIGGVAVALSVALWTVLKATTKIRASEADEFDGLDLAEHDIGAYPDFQQNTIKSYHLREV